nr:hypothetical protein [uncultured Agathobaculum sp.]
MVFFIFSPRFSDAPEKRTSLQLSKLQSWQTSFVPGRRCPNPISPVFKERKSRPHKRPAANFSAPLVRDPTEKMPDFFQNSRICACFVVNKALF